MRTRTACALALMVAVVGAVAAVGLRGVTRAVAAVDSILERDAKLLEHASGLEARTLDLRRYEKDVAICIAGIAVVWVVTIFLARGAAVTPT